MRISMRTVAKTNTASMDSISVGDADILGVLIRIGVRTLAAFVAEEDGERNAREVAVLEVLAVPLFDPMEPRVYVRASHALGASHGTAVAFNAAVLSGGFTTAASTQRISVHLPGEHVFADRV